MCLINGIKFFLRSRIYPTLVSILTTLWQEREREREREHSSNDINCYVSFKITIKFDMIIIEFWSISDFKSYIIVGMTQGEL